MENALISKTLSGALKNSRDIFLGLDYDGTLTPIVKRPDLARFDEDIRKLLKSISLNHKFTVAILSGRAHNDIREQIRIKNIYYSGNHGFEVYLPAKGIIRRYHPMMLNRMKRFSKKLTDGLNNIRGLLIEDKGIILAVHYRNSPQQLIPKILKTVREIKCSYGPNLQLSYGKKVIEIRPPIKKINKGETFQFIIKKTHRKNILPIYLGDDITDENVFRILQQNGIGIFVGTNKSQSYARFYLKNTHQVKRFLEILSKPIYAK